MPIDLLQIALEHHRAGRLTQAESGYHAALAENPSNPDTLHWLGVLLLQAGQIEKAIDLLKQAATASPNDSAYQHNLGHAYRAAGRLDQAIDAFGRAAAIDPSGREAALSFANALLARNRKGDAETAVSALRAAFAKSPDSHEVAHQLGVALLAANQPDQAIAVLRSALSLRKDDATIYFHLALACRKANEPKETRKCFIKALEIDPGMGQAWRGLAMLDAEAGQFNQAAGLFRRAISANRQDIDAHEGLGRALQELGKNDEAKAAFDQAKRLREGGRETPPSKSSASVADLERQLTPTQDQARAHFAMAAIMNVFPPKAIPDESVAGLFDRYAERFDQHLVENLDYRVPERLVAAVTPLWSGKPLDVLDLGCGTGLCGPLIRPMAKSLAGIDLSPGMIEMAAKRGVYDRLDVGNLIDYMHQRNEKYDLLLCADVLMYIGDCTPFFDLARKSLNIGGMLAFSVEAGSGERFDLIPRTRRFTHSRPYIERLTAIFGLQQIHFSEAIVRTEAGKPVVGNLVVLKLGEI